MYYHAFMGNLVYEFILRDFKTFYRVFLHIFILVLKLILFTRLFEGGFRLFNCPFSLGATGEGASNIKTNQHELIEILQFLLGIYLLFFIWKVTVHLGIYAGQINLQTFSPEFINDIIRGWDVTFDY